MPDNDVASQWKSFDDTKRARLLQKMSPDQKKNLRAALGGSANSAAPPANSAAPGPPQPDMLDRARATLDAHTQGKGAGFFRRAANRVVQDIGGTLLDVMTVKTPEQAKAEFDAKLADQQKHPVSSAVAEGVDQFPLLPGVGSQVRGYATSGHAGSDIAGDVATGLLLHGATKAAGAVSDATAGAVKRNVQRVVVGEQPVEELVNKTKEQNAASLKKAAEDTQKQIEKRQAALEKHGQTKAAAAKNAAAKAGKTSRRVALERGVEQLDPKFQEDLQGLEKNVRAQAGEKYNAVRGAYDKTVAQVSADAGEGAADALAEKGLVVKPGDLSSDVKRAEGLIRGSDENLKVFRDILSKYPDEDPDFVELNEGGGSTQIPRGHPLYDVLKEDQVEGAQPATFRDLHGYSAELGKTLSRGGLADDVFRATKTLKESIDARMDMMAKASGAGKQLGEARSFFRDYANAFRDKSSPLYKAMNTTERGDAIAALKDADQSGIGVIGRYDPDLAKRANTLRDHQAEAARLPPPAIEPSTPTASKKTTQQAARRQARDLALGSKQEPVKPVIQKVGPDEIRQAKLGALNKNINWVRHRGKWLATGELFWGALNGILNRSPGQVLRSIGVAAGSIIGADRLTDFARRPDVQEWLTRPTTQDLQYLERLPPEQRAVTQEALRSILEAGDDQKRSGISPALVSFVYGATAVPQTAAEAKRQAEAARQTQASPASAAR